MLKVSRTTSSACLYLKANDKVHFWVEYLSAETFFWGEFESHLHAVA